MMTTYSNSYRRYNAFSLLHLVMVTTNGIARNSNYNMVQNEITLEDLFRQ